MAHIFTAEALKTRLDKFLAEVSHISRSQIQRDIEAGQVLVNGKVQDEPKFIVRKDDAVEYRKVESREGKLEAKNIPIKTLYNNHGLLIIDKPPGLSVHPGAGVKGNSLAEALLFHFKDIRLVGEEGRPGIVHRLDKDTSGVMLIALTQDIYEYLKDAFVERKIKKEYIALVKGRIEKQHGFIDTPIGKSKTDFRKYSTKNMIQAKESLTEYQVLEYLGVDPVRGPMSQDIGRRDTRLASNGVDEYTLILVKLHTGRTHQIRVHLSSLGHPIMGDTLYGAKKTTLSGLSRQFLHAKRIEVQLPDKTWVEAESELAEDLREVLVKLNSKILKTL